MPRDGARGRAGVPEDRLGGPRDEVRLTERRAPEFPELTSAWSITPLAKLRYGMPGPGLWTIYRPGAEPGTWERFGTPSRDPFELLARAAR